jgi:hypothetical protein
MTEIEIDGVFTKTFPVKKYKLFVNNLVLHKSITLIICLINDNSEEVHRIEKKVEGEEYALWGVDDSYLDKIAEAEVNKVLNK